jgi:hypothetical protein
VLEYNNKLAYVGSFFQTRNHEEVLETKTTERRNSSHGSRTLEKSRTFGSQKSKRSYGKNKTMRNRSKEKLQNIPANRKGPHTKKTKVPTTTQKHNKTTGNSTTTIVWTGTKFSDN